MHSVEAEKRGGIARFIGLLSREISRWPERPLLVALFGSAARDEMRDDSDIDLLFIVADAASDLLYDRIGEVAVHAYDHTGHDVRPLVCEVSEVRTGPVFDAIAREGVHIYGDSGWLSRSLRG